MKIERSERVGLEDTWEDRQECLVVAEVNIFQGTCEILSVSPYHPDGGCGACILKLMGEDQIRELQWFMMSCALAEWESDLV